MEEPLTAAFWPQMRATLIRNVLRKKRNKKHTFREIIGPIYFLIIIIIIKLTLPDPHSDPLLDPPGPVDVLSQQVVHGVLDGANITVTPDDDETRQFIQQIQSSQGFGLQQTHFHYIESEAAMAELYEADPASMLMGIVFNQRDSLLKYKIRMTSDKDVLSFQLPDPSKAYAGKDSCYNKYGSGSGLEHPASCPGNGYWQSGFSTIQFAIENTWLKSKNEGHANPKLQLRQLPKPENSGGGETVLRAMIPLYMTFSMSQFLTPMLMVVVDEKEKRIKESMKMVGLRDSVFWLSWFLVYAVLIMVTSLGGSLMVNFAIFSKTNSYYFIILLLMTLYGFSIIMFAFMMTAIFSKAKTAGTAGGISVMLVSCLVLLQVFLNSQSSLFWFMGLLSPSAFAMGIDTILKFDLEGTHLSSAVLWSTEVSGLPVGGVLIMLAVDTLLYGLLAAWLDNIIPTEYGTRRQPWFFLVPSFWLSSSQVQRPLSSLPPLEESVDIEKAPVEQQGKEAVIIRNIQKTFKGIGKSTVKAVQGVSMDIYPGEITAILGHNGAGKSTLFNMLTGMTSASGGSATIFGYDINDSNQMNEIRKMTGICPQHDVLFDELTPREHLQFFARIRGIADQLINTEVDTILADIDLKEKANAIASKLSGGQKRKLSVGIALIGDPKLIFLDEPTAGVDPYSRRHLWSVLKQRKEGKVILLTTHFMDEADILADRKAIMTKGTIRCFGSSLFLKNRFGIGYHLTLVLKDESKVSTIRNAVQATIEGSEQARLFGKELSFVLPRDRVTSFPQLFHLVEKDIYGSGAMGISSYGVSMTTLEEVFLHIGEEEEIEDNDTTNIISSFREKTTRQLSLGAEDILDIPSTSNARPKDKNTSGYSFESIETHKSTWQMFKALLYLRTLIRFREPGMFFIQIVMPVAYICLGVYLSDLSNPKVDKDSEAALTPQMYRDDFNPYFYGYQSVSQSDSSFESDFENFTGKPLDKINYDVKFPELLGRNLVTVIKEEAGNAKYVGYFNDTAQHSIPILVNAMSNAYSMLYDIGNITVSSHPFKLTEIPQEFDGGAFSGNLFIGLTYAFIPCGFALELIYDRQIRAKNQLRVNGLTFPLYFGSIFVVLSILLLFLLCILLALIVAFNFKALLIPAAFGILTSMYILYILPGLLYIGCVSYLFDSMESGQFIFAFASWTGMIPYFAVMLTNSFQVLGGDLATGLHIAFAFISPVYIPFGIIYYIQNQYLFCSITRTCDSLTFSDYMVVEIYILYVALIFHTVFWGIGLKAVDIIKDGGNVRSMFQTKVAAKDNSDKIFNEDHDVQKERDTVESYMKNSTNTSSIPVIGVLGLRKEFTTGVDTKSSRMPCKKTKGDVTMKVAVRNMSLKVEPGEVFGLLGHNGAGKTTAMRMITQEEAVTAGRVRIGEEDITSNQSPAFHQLGYCPQFDALWQRVTVREHLEVYAAIRGVPPHKITALIDGYMAGLRISEHAKKYAKDCSGGTKRKLSYAMAMLGDPRIVLLDEPSTGMDPQSKRFVWDTIEASFKMDRGAILTTHSMEEADALCTRVGIMVKGELRCLGSTQHLKNKFGAGYMLEIKWKTRVVSDWDQLEEEIFKIFPGAESLESFSDRRSWTISQSAVTSLASAFQQLEKCKAQFDIEDYSFSQTTLEQVFIEFAKQQEAEDNDSKAAVTVRSRLEQLPEGNNLTSF